jgi:hypothetical protein
MWLHFPILASTTGTYVTEKSAKQFEAGLFFLMSSVDTWSSQSDNPRIGQDKQSIRELPYK